MAMISEKFYAFIIIFSEAKSKEIHMIFAKFNFFSINVGGHFGFYQKVTTFVYNQLFCLLAHPMAIISASFYASIIIFKDAKSKFLYNQFFLFDLTNFGGHVDFTEKLQSSSSTNNIFFKRIV